MMVAVLGMPRRCAVVMMSIQVRTVDLLVAQELAHLVVEDLGGGARDRAEAVALQHAEVVRVAHAGAARAVHDLHRRERVHVDRREGLFDRDQDVPIRERRHVGIDAALHADLGGAAVDGLLHLGQDGLDRLVVGVGLPALALEGAEAAADEADVGEVDVAVDDVRDVVADVGLADGVGGGDEQRGRRRPRSFEETDALVDGRASRRRARARSGARMSGVAWDRRRSSETSS